jgi:hypothetical protein
MEKDIEWFVGKVGDLSEWSELVIWVDDLRCQFGLVVWAGFHD